jgi:hypothetical protein
LRLHTQDGHPMRCSAHLTTDICRDATHSHNKVDRADRTGRADRSDSHNRGGRPRRVATPHTPRAPAPLAPPRNRSGRRGTFPPPPSRRTIASDAPSSALPLGRVVKRWACHVTQRAAHRGHATQPGPQWHADTSPLASISHAIASAPALMPTRQAARRALSHRCHACHKNAPSVFEKSFQTGFMQILQYGPPDAATSLFPQGTLMELLTRSTSRIPSGSSQNLMQVIPYRLP